MPPTSPVLVAVEASAKERRTRDELAHEAWGDRLTVAAFVEREERLRATPFARAHMRTWLLVGARDRGEVYASLETFSVRSRHGMRAGRSFSVASVFTERRLRGHGYASRLLDEVAARCGRARGAQAMTLYSDVGAALYRRLGYVQRPAVDWRFPARRGRHPRVARSDDQRTLRRLLEAHAPAGRFALLPSAEQVAWHRERERAYASLLGTRPLAHGIVSCDDGFALLAGDLKNEQLVVLALEARTPRAAEELLSACADEASAAALRSVVLWAAPNEADDAAVAAVAPRLDGHRVAREGSLPMLKALPNAPGLVADAWRRVQRIQWV